MLSTLKRMQRWRKAVALAKTVDEISAKYHAEWNGYSVYSSIISFTERLSVGMPYIILVNDTECRFATEEENDEFYHYATLNNLF